MQTCARHCFSRPAQEGKGKDDGWCYCWAFKGIRFEREEKKRKKEKGRKERQVRLGCGNFLKEKELNLRGKFN